jgi:arylsulfatase A
MTAASAGGRGRKARGRGPVADLLVACLLLAFLPATAAVGQVDAERINIVFILADDLGYGDLGCQGCDDIRTPHLDRLAREGVRFTDFYANAPICTPTRAALLTGRYQQRVGLEEVVTYQEFGRGLPEDGTTLAHELRGQGYATGLCGKWHLGYDVGRRPLQQGFDRFFGLLGGNHDYFRHVDRIGAADLWEGNDPVRRAGYSTDLFTAAAIRFVEAHRDRPFFLYLAHAAPHFPWQGPDDEGKIVEPRQPTWQQGDRRTYAAMVERMDEGIGGLVAKIDALGLGPRTLIVFTSDNGGHTHSRNAPLRGEKATLFEGGIRVPCLARWPGTLPAGGTSSLVGLTLDWTATFRRLAGLAADTEREDGIDLVPHLTGRVPPPARPLFWRHTGKGGGDPGAAGRAVRLGRWKLLDLVRTDPQLFDLEADLAEAHDIVDRHPAKAAELGSLLDAWEADVSGAISAAP